MLPSAFLWALQPVLGTDSHTLAPAALPMLYLWVSCCCLWLTVRLKACSLPEWWWPDMYSGRSLLSIMLNKISPMSSGQALALQYHHWEPPGLTFVNRNVLHLSPPIYQDGNVSNKKNLSNTPLKIILTYFVSSPAAHVSTLRQKPVTNTNNSPPGFFG